MKQLITKSDGTPTKSKVYAVKYLQDKGISEDCLIQENGQFFYDEETMDLGTKALGETVEVHSVERFKYDEWFRYLTRKKKYNYKSNKGKKNVTIKNKVN